MRLLLTLLCVTLALPVLGVLGAWAALDEAALAVLRHQAQTVMADYTLQSALLVLGVGLGVTLVGTGAAALVALFDFPGRRAFEWALLLPLAMPAYVLAYAWTDALQYSGPVQVGLRALTGAQGALWPDVRSLWGAVILFVLCLYPYVYLLARAALGERAAPMMEAARLLGAGLRRRIFEVALPLARPAITAGVALALMETLADYGVGSYFGLSTFSTGIYKAWLVMYDRLAAAQLASLLLAAVALLLFVERRAQRRMRFAAARPGGAGSAEARPLRL
ncbi:iron ABC transporter permease, partial [Rubrivivax gelatinosus]|nr:iron ABC transporter permease [Rubrivivax gelatinosus]